MNYFHKILAMAAVLAAVGLAGIGCSAASGSAPESVEPAGTSTPSVGADKATQITMNLSNPTGEMWNLVSATDSGTWQNRATPTLAPGSNLTVSNYSAGSAEVTVVYSGAQSGATYTFVAKVPILPRESATTSGTTTSNTAYQITGSSTGHWNVTFDYVVDGTKNYGFDGTTTTYTVPAGVIRLHVTAVGGGSVTGFPYSPNPSQGAQIDGELPVTPGEVLTIGVGGTGSNSGGTTGGWGMTNGSDNYSGGSGSGPGAGGGGGATVVVDQNKNVLLVAGGGGGAGGPEGISGGDGGYQGSLTGQNGGPNGQGGAAGANNTSQGQNVNNSSVGTPSGPGGGGYVGGLAGPLGDGAAGGAGSSDLGPLYSTTVQAAAATTGSLMLVPDGTGAGPAPGSAPLRR